MIRDNLKFTGVVTIRVTDAQGVLKKECTIKNLVVDAGKAWIAARMTGAPSVMSHMAVGSGNTAAAAGDTALGTPISARVALTSSIAAANKVTHTAVFPAGICTGAWTEAGIFNALTLGTMLARTVFPVINKGAEDGCSITWEITGA